jgi:hypothetical protein
MEAFLVNPAEIRDISSQMLDENGRLRVVPASVLAATTPQERVLFGLRNGLYSFPTEELCSFLREKIAGRPAIEIGAGHGVLAAALGIPATDSRQQEEPAIKAHYARLGQAVVPYGSNVEALPAAKAVAKHRPAVVIACWVTHRYNPARHDAGGNQDGVDEAAIITACDEYIVIGNERVHQHKPIWSLPHELHRPSWLFSRAVNGSPDFIAIWRKADMPKRPVRR